MSSDQIEGRDQLLSAFRPSKTAFLLFRLPLCCPLYEKLNLFGRQCRFLSFKRHEFRIIFWQLDAEEDIIGAFAHSSIGVQQFLLACFREVAGRALGFHDRCQVAGIGNGWLCCCSLFGGLGGRFRCCTELQRKRQQQGCSSEKEVLCLHVIQLVDESENTKLATHLYRISAYYIGSCPFYNSYSGGNIDFSGVEISYSQLMVCSSIQRVICLDHRD